jgi:3-deoxy-D-manno-octulosonic-acid transferase
MRFLYRLLWTLARPLARHLPGRGPLARAVRGRARGARALVLWARRHRTQQALVWFHAASVGEARQAEAALRRVRDLRPAWQIVFTFSSASAERVAAGLGADFAGYVPADTPGEVAAALTAVRPDALVFAATDVWPELVLGAAARGVRTALISATLAPTSSRRSALARTLLRPAYAALDAVGAIDPADAGGLARLGVRPERLTVTGDTRHDAAAARAARVNRSAPHVAVIAAPGPPVLVAGSTWPPDERRILEALASLGDEVSPRLVLAPHQPDPACLGRLERDLRAQLPARRVARLSQLEAALRAGTTAPWEVCLVDRVGVLADLYAAADVAFVGGGFHGRGLHSVIEPAALGVPVLFGPEWRSSRDARLLQDAGAACAVPDGAALAARLSEWLRDPAARTAAGAAARRVVQQGLGAADRSADLIVNLVNRAPVTTT